MNVYRVTIEGQTFEVEIRDINARPVVAVVDGVEIEVWPEERPLSPPVGVPGQPAKAPAPKPPAANGSAALSTANGSRTGGQVLAPMPGTIVSVEVKPGDKVSVGQAMCVLEAMKMKNVIRASRSGTVTAIHISTGQTVKHHELLVELAA